MIIDKRAHMRMPKKSLAKVDVKDTSNTNDPPGGPEYAPQDLTGDRSIHIQTPTEEYSKDVCCESCCGGRRITDPLTFCESCFTKPDPRAFTWEEENHPKNRRCCCPIDRAVSYLMGVAFCLFMLWLTRWKFPEFEHSIQEARNVTQAENNKTMANVTDAVKGITMACPVFNATDNSLLHKVLMPKEHINEIKEDVSKAAKEAVSKEVKLSHKDQGKLLDDHLNQSTTMMQNIMSMFHERIVNETSTLVPTMSLIGYQELMPFVALLCLVGIAIICFALWSIIKEKLGIDGAMLVYIFYIMTPAVIAFAYFKRQEILIISVIVAVVVLGGIPFLKELSSILAGLPDTISDANKRMKQGYRSAIWDVDKPETSASIIRHDPVPKKQQSSPEDDSTDEDEGDNSTKDTESEGSNNNSSSSSTSTSTTSSLSPTRVLPMASAPSTDKRKSEKRTNINTLFSSTGNSLTLATASSSSTNPTYIKEFLAKKNGQTV